MWRWALIAAGLLLLVSGGAAYAIAYANGKPLGKIKLIPMDGKLVAERVAQAFLAMQDAAKAAGVTLTLSSGFRTMEEQQRLYDAYRAGTGNYAAQPGYSNHQNGTAVDISVRSSFTSPEYLWLAQNAARYGFKNTGATFPQPEPWHWELIA